MAKLLAFSGSGRKDSWNQKLVSFAGAAAKKAGAEVTVVNLKEFQMPLYDGDFEAEHGLPDGVQHFKQLMRDHQGLLIASPEYNSSVSPLLKNAIDWASRPTDGEAPLEAFNGKVAGLMATSPGGLGGLRGLVHLRAILQNINVLVVPKQLAIGKAHEAFDDSGNLTTDFHREGIEMIAQKVVELTDQINR